MKSAAYRIGFGRRDLNARGIYPSRAFLAPLEVRCFVLETDTRFACWMVFDLTALLIAQSDAIRTEVARVLECPRENVVVHCTHTHSVPDPFCAFSDAILAEQAAGAAREARSRLERFRLVTSTVDVGTRFSVLRRCFLPGLGAFTVWYGHRLAGGPPDGTALVREQLQRMFGGRCPPAVLPKAPVLFDQPVDPLVQGLVFVAEDGRTLGTLLRFAAHPHTTSHVEHLRYHPDFPGFARAAIEREIGGMCLYLTGPCGDISPKEEMRFRMARSGSRRALAAGYFGPSYWHKEAEPGMALRAARRLGNAIAAALLQHLVGDNAGKCTRSSHGIARRSWRIRPEFPTVVRAQGIGLTVPIRDDYADSLAAARRTCTQELRRLRELQRDPAAHAPWAIRSLADGVQRRALEAFDLRCLPEPARRSRGIVLELGLLRIGPLVLAGLPGEPCVGTTLRLRADTLGARLWTVSLVNGWCGYLPDKLMCLAGGYEAARTPLPPDGLLRYEAQAAEAICRLLAEDSGDLRSPPHRTRFFHS